jgi:hypothetical protein
MNTLSEMVVGTSAGSYMGSSLTGGHFFRLRSEFDFFRALPLVVRQASAALLAQREPTAALIMAKAPTTEMIAADTNWVKAGVAAFGESCRGR